VTCSVMLEIPAVVGVPLISQLFCVRPAGRVPEVVQVYGVVPPVTGMVAKYGLPTVPFSSFVNDSVRASVMVRDIGPDTLSCGLEASVTVIVGFAVPCVVGVPVIAQLFGVNANPVGRVPPVTVQTYGPVPPVTPTDPV